MNDEEEGQGLLGEINDHPGRLYEDQWRQFICIPVYPRVSFTVQLLFIGSACLTPVKRLLSTALELLANPRAAKLIRTNYINPRTVR